MISAYGMQTSIFKKGPGYLNHFWRNRLISLLVPCLLINVCSVTYASLKTQSFVGLEKLFSINGYVIVLLQYCVLFFVVETIKEKAKWKFNEIPLLAMGVVASSLLIYLPASDYSNSAQLGWCFERIGLVWGLLLFAFFPKIVNWMNEKYVFKTIIACLLSLGFGLAYLANKTVWFWGEYCLKIILGFTIILFVLLLTKNRSFGNIFINHLGNISYEIYLSHGLIMGIVAYLFPHLSSRPLKSRPARITIGKN